MKNPDRWKQRFDNFEKAFLLLEKILKEKELNEIEEIGLIQTFEFTFELGWKTLKDKLEFEGVEASFPRQVIKEAFNGGYIEDGEIWIEAMEDRNSIAHIYDSLKMKSLLKKIKEKYYPHFSRLYTYLKKCYE